MQKLFNSSICKLVLCCQLLSRSRQQLRKRCSSWNTPCPQAGSCMMHCWLAQSLASCHLQTGMHQELAASQVQGALPTSRLLQGGCRGNRLVIISREPLGLSLKMPHHKNEKACGQRPIEFDLHQAYAELLLTFVDQGQKE